MNQFPNVRVTSVLYWSKTEHQKLHTVQTDQRGKRDGRPQICKSARNCKQFGNLVNVFAISILCMVYYNGSRSTAACHISNFLCTVCCRCNWWLSSQEWMKFNMLSHYEKSNIQLEQVQLLYSNFLMFC